MTLPEQGSGGVSPLAELAPERLSFFNPDDADPQDGLVRERRKFSLDRYKYQTFLTPEEIESHLDELREPMIELLGAWGVDLETHAPLEKIPAAVTARMLLLTEMRSRGLEGHRIESRTPYGASTQVRDYRLAQAAFGARNFNHLTFLVAGLKIMPELDYPRRMREVKFAGAAALYLTAQGMSPGEVGEIVDIPKDTINTRNKATRLAWGANNTSQAIRFGLQIGRLPRTPLEDYRHVEEALDAVKELTDNWKINGNGNRNRVRNGNGSSRSKYVKDALTETELSPETSTSLLSPREEQIFNLVTLGVPVYEITSQLECVEEDIVASMKNVIKKLGARNLANATYEASASDILLAPNAPPQAIRLKLTYAHTLYLKAQGYSNEEVAEMRGFSLKVANSHEKAILDTFGVRNVLAAIRVGVHYNKIPDTPVEDPEELEKVLKYMNPTLKASSIIRLNQVSFGKNQIQSVKKDYKAGLESSRSMERIFAQLKAKNASHAVRRGFETGILQKSGNYEGITPPRLNEVESVILEFHSQGHTLVEIAEKFSYTPAQVKNGSIRLRRKLGAKNLPHAVRIAVESGILDTSTPMEMDTEY